MRTAVCCDAVLTLSAQQAIRQLCVVHLTCVLWATREVQYNCCFCRRSRNSKICWQRLETVRPFPRQKPATTSFLLVASI